MAWISMTYEPQRARSISELVSGLGEPRVRRRAFGAFSLAKSSKTTTINLQDSSVAVSSITTKHRIRDYSGRMQI